MSKIRNKTKDLCIICDETINYPCGITLHKTRRQCHSICSTCLENYLKEPVRIIYNNLRQNIRKNIQYINCPGTYKGLIRNKCKAKIDIKSLICVGFPDIIRITYILNNDHVYLCPNKNCDTNIETEPEKKNCSYCGSTELHNSVCTICETKVNQETIPVINCPTCEIVWCKQCLYYPYHYGKTCLEHELEENKTETAKFIQEMTKKNKIKLCPQCKSPIYKNGGCNKMHCYTCNSKWCWLCNQLNIDYDHYNENSQTPCKARLWEGVNIELEEDRIEIL